MVLKLKINIHLLFRMKHIIVNILLLFCMVLLVTAHNKYTAEGQTEQKVDHCDNHDCTTTNESAAHDGGKVPEGHMKRFGEHTNTIEGEITVLDYSIGPEDFYEHFIRKRKPVLFKGVANDWPCSKHWGNETYLRERFGDELFHCELGKKFYSDHIQPMYKRTMNEFLDGYKTEDWYLNGPFPHSRMQEDLRVPLMNDCKSLKFHSTHIFYSTGGTSSPLHWDGYDNYISVFSGKKIVYAIDPKYVRDLHYDMWKNWAQIVPIDPEAVDLVKYPNFKWVPVHKVRRTTFLVWICH